MEHRDKWDWFAYGGYLVVGLAFSVTLYATIKGVAAQKHGDAYAYRHRWRYNIMAALIAAVWPISLPVATILATAAVMAGRSR